MAENRALSLSLIAWALRCADAVAVGVAGLLAHYSRFDEFLPEGNYALAYLFVTAVAPFVFHSLNLYNYDRISREPMQFQRLGIGLLSLVFLTLAVGYLTKTSIEFSRIWMSIWGLLSILFLVAIRIVLWIKIRQWQARGWLSRRIAVVGAGDQGQRLVRYFADTRDPSVVLIGIFDDRRTRVPNQIGDSPVRGTVDDLLEIVRSERVDEVIVALPWSAEGRLLELLQKLRRAPTHVRLSPEAIAFRFPHRAAAAIEGVSMLSVHDRSLSNWSRVLKRLEDQILSVLIPVFIAPLLLAIAAAVKLSSRGPVLVRARRYGFDNEPFEAFGFRTHAIEKEDADGSKPAVRGNPGITRVGRFLREIGLDRIPRFINVLRGEMSIVGPLARTEIAGGPKFPYEEIVAEYFARHRVKPGITGWAQVNGWGGESETQAAIERRIEHDLDYIDRWSVWFDLKIILMTPFTTIFGSTHD
jgi:Undecaprenyl-phosphate glucose phosphotransferase